MGSIFSAFRGVFANRDLRRVEIAAVGSLLAAFSFMIVLAVVAYDASGTTGVGILMVTRMAAAALTTPFTSTFADRYPRKRVMIISNLLSAATIGVIAAGVAADIGLPGLCALAALSAVFSGLFRPAQAALLPSLARTPEELTAANAVATTIEGVAIFFGPGIGGILLGVSGATATFAFAAAGMLWSAALVTFVHEPTREPEEAEADAPPTSRFHEATAGIRTLAHQRALLAVVGVYAAQTVVAGALGVFNVVLALQVFDLGNAGVGYLDSAFGVGGIIGGVLAAGLAGSRRLGAWFALGCLVWGIGISLVGVAPTTLVVFALLAAVGAGNTVVDVAAITLIQRSAPPAVLARVFGIIESVLLSGLGIGSILAPALIHLLGAREAIVVTGLLLPASVLLLGRRVLSLDRVGEELIPIVEMLRGTSIFAPLPQAQLEQLARRLEPLKVPAGTVVITEGEPGDLFYLVVEGEAAITAGGERVFTTTAGGFFGEIALLRDTARTATVTAETDLELYTLERDEFLAAVTGHTPTAEQADMVTSQRLADLRSTVAAI